MIILSYMSGGAPLQDLVVTLLHIMPLSEEKNGEDINNDVDASPGEKKEYKHTGMSLETLGDCSMRVKPLLEKTMPFEAYPATPLTF